MSHFSLVAFNTFFLSLVFCHLIIWALFLWVYSVRAEWVSWTSRCVFDGIWEIFILCFFKCLFCVVLFLLFFWVFYNTNAGPLKTIHIYTHTPQDPKALCISWTFSLLFKLHNLCWPKYKFVDFFPLSSSFHYWAHLDCVLVIVLFNSRISIWLFLSCFYLLILYKKWPW